jgi:uncharacterized membrane protein YqjE
MTSREPAGSSGPGPDVRSTPEVLASFLVNAQALLAKELELFRLELRGIVARKLAALGLILTGALAAVGVLGLATVTAAVALEDVFTTRWHAWGVVTLAFLVVSLLLVGIALRLLAGPWLPSRARSQLGTTSRWARGLVAASDAAGFDGPGADDGPTAGVR